jgi:hypothetical protein
MAGARGAAFLYADLNLTPEIREDHAAYIATWITVLQNEKRAIDGQGFNMKLDYLPLNDAEIVIRTPKPEAEEADAAPEAAAPAGETA